MEKNITINFSTKTILKILLVIASLIFLYYIRNIILLVFIVLIIIAGLNPILMYFDKLQIPRAISITILYLLLAGFSVFFLYIIIPPVIEQTANLINNIPSLISKLPDNIANFLHEKFISNRDELFSLTKQLENISEGLLGYIVSFFGSVTSIVLALVISFYLLLRHDSVEKTFFSFINPEKRKKSMKIYEKISGKLGNWFRNRIILSIFVFALSFIILKILNIQYPLSLSMLTGILDIIPIVGPISATIIICVITLMTAAWWKVLVIIVWMILITQLEDNYLAPKIMGKSLGLSPVIIILVFASGAQIGGVVGSILAIPIAAGAYVFMQEWQEIKKIIF